MFAGRGGLVSFLGTNKIIQTNVEVNDRIWEAKRDLGMKLV